MLGLSRNIRTTGDNGEAPLMTIADDGTSQEKSRRHSESFFNLLTPKVICRTGRVHVHFRCRRINIYSIVSQIPGGRTSKKIYTVG